MEIILQNKKYDVVLMDTFFKRLKGLMFKVEPISKIYLFPRCSSIHTYFMKQNIDVCMLDRNFLITYIGSNIERGRVIIKKGYYTLEMPLGATKGLKVGDKLLFK